MRIHSVLPLLFIIPLAVSYPKPPTDWEKEFKNLPDPSRIRETQRILSGHPHLAGSAQDRTNAEWIYARFKEWGLDASIDSFDVLIPTPKDRLVELVTPPGFVASLREPVVAADPTSAEQNAQVPTYNAYSGDGDVVAPLVYVNYGTPDDYDRLDRMGISVRGAIVITRYGAVWRGTKPKVAAEHGAIGCLIYSDPSGDGYYRGDPYPAGAWRPPDGVQRGSVIDMPIYPGDPLTPGIPAWKNAKRLSLDSARTLMRIPVMPLSFADAKPLMSALTGRVAPQSWRGSLPITYHIGPGAAKVHLVMKSSWDMKTIYDVIGRIDGSNLRDEWVIRGNHQDAWVFGAEDPLSGLAPMLEEARSFSRMLKEGWKPERTIVFCAWDGEEEGLLGSTEWVEAHDRDLWEHGVLYINSDGNGRGFLNVGGSHSLEHFINDVARDVVDPETGLSVWKRSQLRQIADASSADDRAKIRQQSDLRIGALGSGSDYTAFLCHAGIPSLNLGYGGEDGGGIYHSIYDSFYWFTHFSDTNFVYCKVLAQTAGTALLRAADEPILPYRYANVAVTVRTYADDLQKLLKQMQDDIQETNKELDEGVFPAIADPHIVSVPPKGENVPPFLNFAPLLNALASLERSARHFDDAVQHVRDANKAMPHAAERIEVKIERNLCPGEGLPDRPWFKNILYAPGTYTGYGVKTLPGIREAIEQKKWDRAGEQIPVAARALEAEAAALESAATEIGNALQ